MKEGDAHILRSFQRLKKLIEDYGDSIKTISSLLDYFIVRLKAIIEPTPENKLKAVGLPSTAMLNIKICEKINSLSKLRRSILQEVKELEESLNNSKIICDYCEGKGKIPRTIITRGECGVKPVIVFKRCPRCNGLGYFSISKNVQELGSGILKSIKKLK